MYIKRERNQQTINKARQAKHSVRDLEEGKENGDHDRMETAEEPLLWPWHG